MAHPDLFRKTKLIPSALIEYSPHHWQECMFEKVDRQRRLYHSCIPDRERQRVAQTGKSTRSPFSLAHTCTFGYWGLKENSRQRLFPPPTFRDVPVAKIDDHGSNGDSHRVPRPRTETRPVRARPIRKRGVGECVCCVGVWACVRVCAGVFVGVRTYGPPPPPTLMCPETRRLDRRKWRLAVTCFGSIRFVWFRVGEDQVRLIIAHHPAAAARQSRKELRGKRGSAICSTVVGRMQEHVSWRRQTWGRFSGAVRVRIV